MLYVGVDHHKHFSYLKVIDGQGRVKKEGRVNNARSSVRGFMKSLDGQARCAVLEAGRNWTVMYDWLEEEVDEVKLAHPLKVKAIADAKIKTDKIDAGTLAQLLRCDLIPEAHVTSRSAREAKNVLRHRMFLVRLGTMVKNRIHALVDRQPGVAAGLKGTDLFGRSGRRLLEALKLPATDRRLLNEELGLLDQIHQHILSSNQLVRQLAKESRQVKHLETIPGIGTFFAVLIATEIDGVERFRNDRKLHSYMGLVPSTYASGDKVFHGRITRQGNKWLRWAFVEAVWPAVCKDPALRQMYERIKETKNANAAKVAVARRLATIAYQLLKYDRDYEVRNDA